MSSDRGTIRAMALGDPKYTEQQKDAMAAAYVDRRVRPARRVVELAAAGQLMHDGEPLEPFQTNDNTVRNEARRLLKRRRGELVSDLASSPPRDAIEALRRRCVNAADALLKDYEKAPAKKRDPERLRQIIRVVREAAALPGPDDSRPTAPGHSRDKQRNGGETQGGIGGALLKDHRTSQARPAHDGQQHRQEDGEHHRLNGNTHEQQHAQTDERPGSRSAEQLA